MAACAVVVAVAYAQHCVLGPCVLHVGMAGWCLRGGVCPCVGLEGAECWRAEECCVIATAAGAVVRVHIAAGWIHSGGGSTCPAVLHECAVYAPGAYRAGGRGQGAACCMLHAAPTVT